MNTMQRIANAIRETSRGFSDTTSHGDMGRRIADAIEAEARKDPGFSDGHAVSQKLLDMTSRK